MWISSDGRDEFVNLLMLCTCCVYVCVESVQSYPPLGDVGHYWVMLATTG